MKQIFKAGYLTAKAGYGQHLNPYRGWRKYIWLLGYVNGVDAFYEALKQDLIRSLTEERK